MTDKELAIVEADTYSAEPSGQVITFGDDLATIVRIPGSTIVSLRGTTTPAQWVSNFKVLGVMPAEHPQLGVCEAGFLEGALALYPLLRAQLGDNPAPIVLQGHSRGAGMVPILAALMLLDGTYISRAVCWESPWAVGDRCAALCRRLPGNQYWHGDDPVPTVPAVSWLVPNVWPMIYFGQWTLNPFDSHGMTGIIADLPA